MLTFSLYTSLLRTHAQKVIWGPFGMNGALGSLGIYRWHLYVASPTYVSCVALRARSKLHLTGPKRGSLRGCRHGFFQPRLPPACQAQSEVFQNAGCCPHTDQRPQGPVSKTALPRWPPASEMRGGGGTKAQLRTTRSQSRLVRPASSHQRAAGWQQAVPKAWARYWLFVPMLCCHQTRWGKVLPRDWRLLLTNTDSSQSIAPGQLCRSS